MGLISETPSADQSVLKGTLAQLTEAEEIDKETNKPFTSLVTEHQLVQKDMPTPFLNHQSTNCASPGATLKLHFSQWQTNEILWSSKHLLTLSDFPFTSTSSTPKF